MIHDHNDEIVVTRRNTSWTYKTLGAAKTAAKLYIKHKNRRLNREHALRFEDFEVVEYELLEKERHPL
jgi:hypothetical protein